MKLKLLACSITATLIVASFGNAHASGAMGVVLDPTNLVQNTTTAVKAVAADMKQAQIVYQTLKANANSMKTGGFGETAAQKAVVGLAKYINANDQLGGALGAEAKLLANITAEWGASGKSWQQYTASKKKQIALGDGLSKQQLDLAKEAIESIKKSTQQRQAILAELPTITGVTDAARTTTEMLNALVGVNEDVLKFMAQDSKEKAI
jgi:type IV secretion system protein TrbJ